ncbi:MAG: DUF58 domain-containing protein [Propionibacteriaceae bacterium]|jgi:uncharacterized protein (DUF58 family)|nr:DUF58 domain-containing protein [Propionibacteriaceae bacterium]
MTQVSFAPPAAPSLQSAVSTVISAPTGATLPLSRLAPEAALKRLELVIVRRLEGFLQGDHLGLLPGAGSDTSDARVYVPGQDDIRRMDWAVTARTTIPHVRDTIADRELEVWALLDVTPSMNWGTAGVTKRDLGIAAIATIGFLSQKLGDRFGGMIMDPNQVTRIPARAGRMALYSLLRTMLTTPIVPDNTHGQFDLTQGMEQMVRTQRRRGLRLVVSDFLTTGDTELDPRVETAWERPLRQLSVRNQVICVEVVDPRELEFPDLGEILIRDPETHFDRYVDTSNAAARARLNAATRAQRERIRVSIRRAGAAHIQLRTDRDWVQDIARFVLAYRRIAGQLHTPPRGVSR